MPSAVRVVDRIQDQGDFASALSWAGKQTFQTSILVGSGTVNVGTSGVGVVVIGTSTVPTTAPADEVQLYSADWEGTAGDARLHVYSEAGTIVTVGNGAVVAKKPASGAGNSLTLAGSAAASGNTNGGDLALSPGAKSGSGADGNVTLARGKFVFPGGPTLAAPGVNVTTLDAPGQAQGSLVVTANGVNTACVQIVGSAGVVSGGVWMSSINLLGWSPSNPPTAAIDTSFSRAAARVVRVGNGNTGAGGLSSAANSPAQLTADQNNYAPGVGLFQRWSSDASRTVTGVVAGQDGEWRQVWNVGTNDIVLANESASSTAANRFTTATGADVTLSAKKCAFMQYDATSTRWRLTLLP